MKILIAEDEISTAKALKVILEKSKFSVDIVHNGNDAWSYIQAGPYEVIAIRVVATVFKLNMPKAIIFKK